MNEQIKHQITEALKSAREGSSFKSNAKFARSIGITDTDYSNIINLKWVASPQLLSKAKWATVARAIKFQANHRKGWQTAQTKTYRYITKQLEACRDMSVTAMLVDEAGIGKTYTCEDYANRNRGEVVYMNCSQCPGKVRFVNTLAEKLGINLERTVEDTFQACIYYIVTFLDKPLLILDEAGDLEQSAILLLKRLYNSTEFQLGIFMCGANGFAKKMNAGVRLNKNGYVELASRMGRGFNRSTPTTQKGKQAMTEFIREEVETICLANGITDTEAMNKIINSSADLRQAARKIRKAKWMLERAGNGQTKQLKAA